MINILPLEDRRDLKKEYFRKFVVVFFLFFAFILLAGIIMLLPSVLFLDENEKNYMAELTSLDKKIESAGILETKKVADDLNKKIKSLNETSPFGPRANVVTEIMSAAQGGIRINSFSITTDEKSEKLFISGNATTRKDLLGFIENMKSCKGSSVANCAALRKVDSPVSNIVKEKDIDFSIKVDTMLTAVVKK